MRCRPVPERAGPVDRRKVQRRQYRAGREQTTREMMDNHDDGRQRQSLFLHMKFLWTGNRVVKDACILKFIGSEAEC